MEYPAQIVSGTPVAFKMWWVNSGVAPIYEKYTLAVALDDHIMKTTADIKKWLPGDAVVEEPLTIPQLPPKTYRVRVALLDPKTGKPAIRLGTEGRAADGWYDVGTAQVSR
jgi:hypothetical protein